MTKDFQPFITLVDQILSAKQQPPSSPFIKGELSGVSPLERGKGVCADTAVLERQIDQLGYNLYNLTPDEIAVMKGKELKSTGLSANSSKTGLIRQGVCETPA